MSDDDDLIRGHLGAVMPDPPNEGVLASVAGRKARRRTVRRARAAGVGLLALTLVATASVAIARDDKPAVRVSVDQPEEPVATSTTLAATTTSIPTSTTITPPDGAPSTIIAVVGPPFEGQHRLVELETASGRELRTLAAEVLTIDPATALSPDGRTVFFTGPADKPTACAKYALKQVPLAGGAPVEVPQRVKGVVSPDGRKMAYIEWSTPSERDGACVGGGTEALIVRDLVSGDEQRWPNAPETTETVQQACCGLAWSPDNRHLAYTTSQVDNHYTWVLDTESTPTVLPAGREVKPDSKHEWEGLQFRDDGTLLVAGQWWYEPDNETRSVIADETGRVLLDFESEATSLDVAGNHLLMRLINWHIGKEEPVTTSLVRYDGKRLVEIRQDVNVAVWGPR